MGIKPRTKTHTFEQNTKCESSLFALGEVVGKALLQAPDKLLRCVLFWKGSFPPACIRSGLGFSISRLQSL